MSIEENNMSKIGVVILNYKNWQVTIKCLQNVLRAISENDEIIVIDNGSKNDSIKNIKEHINSPKIHFVENDENLGFAKANNQGFWICKKMKCDFCFFTNSDIIIDPGCLKKLSEIFMEYSDAVLVGPRILTPQNAITKSSCNSPVRFLDYFGLSRFAPRCGAKENLDGIVEKVYSVSGCCFMVDVRKFSEIGMFDENTFLYNEENILACRIENRGYSEYFTSRTSVVHEHGASSGRKNTFVYTALLKSTLYYLKIYRNYSWLKLYTFLCLYYFKAILAAISKNEIDAKKIYVEGKKYLFDLYK